MCPQSNFLKSDTHTINDILNDDLLRLMLRCFVNQPETFFIRLVCKKWAAALQKSLNANPNSIYNVPRVAAHYARNNCRSALEWLDTNYLK